MPKFKLLAFASILVVITLTAWFFLYAAALGVIVSTKPLRVSSVGISNLQGWIIDQTKGWIIGNTKTDLTRPQTLEVKGLDIFDYTVFLEVQKPAGRNLFARLNNEEYIKIGQDTTLKLPSKIGMAKFTGWIKVDFYADESFGRNFYGDEIVIRDLIVKKAATPYNLQKMTGRIEEWTLNNFRADRAFLIFYGLLLLLSGLAVAI